MSSTTTTEVVAPATTTEVVVATTITNGESSRSLRRRRRHRRRASPAEAFAAERLSRGADGCDPFLPPLPTRPGVDVRNAPPHPRGAAPHGNRLLSARPDRRTVGLGGPRCGLRRIGDEVLAHVLSFLAGPDLGRVGRACASLLVAARADELWRDLVLRGDDRGATTGAGAGAAVVLDSFGDTWYDTYARRRAGGDRAPRRVAPLRVDGVFSDAAYRSHLCGAFAFDATAALSDPRARCAPRVDARDDACAASFLDHEARNVPCVVTHVGPAGREHERALSDRLSAEIDPSAVFRATSGAAPLPAVFTWSGYRDYCDAFDDDDGSCLHREEAPLYLFERDFADKCGGALRDRVAALRRACPFLDPDNAAVKHDLFSRLGPTRRPDHRWLIAGRAGRSGSSFHVDPNATHAWNAPLVGRKYWILYPPDGPPPPGVRPSPDGDDVAVPLSMGEWFLTCWDEHVKRRKGPADGRPYECVVEPGELIFVPHGWWHCVWNLADEQRRRDSTVSVALTQNYVSERNLSDVIRFCRLKKRQISGCRDRPGEAVSPDSLLEEWRTAVRNSGVEGDREMWDRAEKRADEGWACAAWRDDQDVEVENKNKNDTQSRRRKRRRGGGGDSVMARAKAPTTTTTATMDGKEEKLKQEKQEGGGFTFSFL